MVLTGFTVGFALFYEVGFVLMLPLVFTIAASANIPLLYVGVPMAAALSVTHGFLPPHPGPTAIATIFNADMGKTLLYGTILAIPTVILAGPVYARVLKVSISQFRKVSTARKPSVKKRCRALASASGPLWCR